MNNFFNKFSRTMKKGNAFMIIVIILVLGIALTSLYFAFFIKKTTGTGIPAVEPQSTTEEDRIKIKDIEGNDSTIPKFDIPLNTYDKAKFVKNGDRITYSGNNAYFGVDISEWQGEIDWAAVKESGVDFAFIRAAWRGKTKGKIYADKNFKANITGATDSGIKVGVYLFSQAITLAEAEEEAAYIVELLGPYKDKIDYPVVFDWEDDGNPEYRVVSAKGEDVSTYAAAFCKNIARAGYKPMVYMNKTIAYNFYDLEVLKDYDFWIAEYETTPTFYYDFTAWQYSDSAKVNGIEGDVDVNISFKEYKR